MTDHNKSSSSNGTDRSYEHLAMPYDEFDIMLKDINEEELEKLGEAYDIGHLSDGTFVTPAFPVQGKIHGPNSRFMVPLVCKRSRKPNSKVINIWFLLDTGSLFTCLTIKTLESFLGAGNVTDGKFYPMVVQDPNSEIECQVSKVGTHFEHVNILGVDAMRLLNVSPIVNWRQNTFRLTEM